LDTFYLQSWVIMNNLFEKYDIRRYPSEVRLLYILAERNFGQLIKSHFSEYSPIEASTERYEMPFLAALAAGSTDAVRAFAELQVRTNRTPLNPFQQLCQEYLGHPDEIPKIGRDFSPEFLL
jgi:hypothetical protein